MKDHYLVVTVTDPGDRDAGIAPYAHRFEFGDPEEALECSYSAHRAGFEVTAATVSGTRKGTPTASVRT
jgi:hypothetical protein